MLKSFALTELQQCVFSLVQMYNAYSCGGAIVGLGDVALCC